MINLNLLYLFAVFLLSGFTRCADLDEEIAIIDNYYAYQDYYSSNIDSCVVANNETGNRPTIQFCNGEYKISNKTLILPRNTFPICAYFPEWYDLTAEFTYKLYKNGPYSGNITYEEGRKECESILSRFSKSRFKEMYKVNAHELMCMRVSEFKVGSYGRDPKVVELRNKVQSLIQDKVKWDNTEFQADLIMSSYCFGTNKQSCIALVQHLLDERNNSALNLLGYDIQGTPTTWLYADGIDIVLLHIITEIFGMTIEHKVIRDISYYSISPDAPSGENTEYLPGLFGGCPGY